MGLKWEFHATNRLSFFFKQDMKPWVLIYTDLLGKSTDWFLYDGNIRR